MFSIQSIVLCRSTTELDFIVREVARQRLARQVLNDLNRKRRASRTAPLQIWAVRRAMKGATHKRSGAETRGRKRKLDDAAMKRVVTARTRLIRQSKGCEEVTHERISKNARVKVHKSTVGRHLRARGVWWRRLREKPPRTSDHIAARKDVCRRWKDKPLEYWLNTVDLIIDCKKFPIPTSAAAAARLQSHSVRGVPRTRGEGLCPGMTKASIRKHKFNPGGQVRILGGICGDRVVLWEEIQGKWCGAKAEEMYAGPIKRVLQRLRPHKVSWLILEDGDPSGFKSGKGKAAKRANHMRSLDQPAYSPDLNPLDFSVWNAIEKRALARAKMPITVAMYKRLLRRVALSMPKGRVQRSVLAIKSRAKAIYNANGGNIKMD